MFQSPVKPDVSFVSANVILENPQSTGVVTLRSSNPNDAPLFDPKFLTHPFDRRVMIEAIKDTFRLLKAPVYADKTIEVLGPKDDSDDAIWEHIKRHTGSSWHMSCTIRMGRDPETACVDSNFRVFGIERLRVVDLSVCPFVPK
jgi:choline dehydrogenase-like flavoprotein